MKQIILDVIKESFEKAGVTLGKKEETIIDALLTKLCMKQFDEGYYACKIKYKTKISGNNQ